MSTYVLIVDDNRDAREILSRALQKDGLECICVENGLQALAQVAMRRPGLVISDVMMPEMNGLALLSTLQRATATAGIPVFLISGVVSPQMMQLPGVVKVIQKGSLDLAQLRVDALEAMGMTSAATE